MLEMFLTGLAKTLLLAPLAVPLLLVRAHRSKRPVAATVLVLLLAYAGVVAYGMYGMDYEDNDRPLPFVLGAGVVVAVVELAATVTLLALHLWLWFVGWLRARKQGQALSDP